MSSLRFASFLVAINQYLQQTPKVTTKTMTTSGSHSDTTANNIKYHIMIIPPEIRLEIYDHYFTSFKLDIKADNTSADEGRALKPPLLATCKRIREEALTCYEARLKTLLECNEQKLQEKLDANMKDTNADPLPRPKAHLVILKIYGQTKTVYSRKWSGCSWTERV